MNSGLVLGCLVRLITKMSCWSFLGIEQASIHKGRQFSQAYQATHRSVGVYGILSESAI